MEGRYGNYLSNKNSTFRVQSSVLEEAHSPRLIAHRRKAKGTGRREQG